MRVGDSLSAKDLIVSNIRVGMNATQMFTKARQDIQNLLYILK